MKRIAVLMILTMFFSCVGISEIPAVANLPGMSVAIVNAAELSVEKDVWDGTAVDYSWYDGHESPYTISTAAQFAAFGNILNKVGERDDRFAGKTIQLAADLDMDGKPFRAMGGHEEGGAFEGTFEGQEHIISNLNITQAGLNGDYVALFSRLSNGAAIRNLGLEGVTLDVSDANNQAALVGVIAFGSNNTVENCFVRDADIKLTLPFSQFGKAGGLVADVSQYSDNNSTRVTNCYTVNVRFSPRENTSGDLGMGVGHFAGFSDGGTFTNCYSGGVTGSPSDSALPHKVMSFGILKENVTDTNCYSDCYADDSEFGWHFDNGFKRGGSKVPTDDLKTMGGAVSALSEQFFICDIEGYNSGYPILSWEMARFKEPPIKLSIEKKTKNSVIFDAIDGAEFSANGRDWQNDREFHDLSPGVYVFRAKRDSESTELTVTIGGIEVWDGSVDYSWYDGQRSPYTISTPAQFAAFGNILNKLDGRDDRFANKAIKLAADLDMDNMPFRAMGGLGSDGTAAAFSGTFEGQGHIISNLNITKIGVGDRFAALFANISGGTVRNLGLEGVTLNVNGVESQAAFAGVVMGDSVSTIENCFVRDVNISLTLPITSKVGGFVADLTPWPENNCVKNCYAVNVRFSRKAGEGDVGVGMGHFTGESDGATFINCYSGGVTERPSDSTLPHKVMSFGILKEIVTDTNCYSDCYADDSEFSWHFDNGFKRGGSRVSTADLKGMTGDVALGDGFGLSAGDNYGYPQLLWELERPNQSDEFSAKDMEITADGSEAQVKISGLKNNFAVSQKPLLFIISYKNGRIAAINTKEIEMEAYDYEPNEIALSVDMSGADTVRAFMLKGADNVVPVLESKEVKK